MGFRHHEYSQKTDSTAAEHATPDINLAG